jgi:hypothetical protein
MVSAKLRHATSIWFVPCIVQSNNCPKGRILMPYPSSRVCRSVHEAPATLFFLLRAEVPALLCPPTRCSHIFPPCWHSRISPKKGNLGGGVGGESSVPEAKIPRGVLWNARPGTLLGDSVDWWTLGLGGPVNEIQGVPFTCQVPSLVGML